MRVSFLTPSPCHHGKVTQNHRKMSTVSDVDVPTSYRGKVMENEHDEHDSDEDASDVSRDSSEFFSFLFLYFTNNYLLWTLQLSTVTSTIARCSSKEGPTTPALEGGDWGMGAGDSSGSRCVGSVASRAPSIYIFFQFFTLLYTSLFVKSTQIILLNNLDFK